jgi:predicted DNA-binding transcriptional regulator AlpA
MFRDYDDSLLDEHAAGVYLGGSDAPISPRTMQRWRGARTGPAYVKIGRLVRYRRSALDDYLASCEHTPSA